MKPLFILMRITFVGALWSILFLEGIRVILLTNWHFDIFKTAHWLYAWRLWLSGWIIDDPKEWAFILIILTFIPVWLTGWMALSLVNWGKFFNKALNLPLLPLKKIFEKQVQKITSTASVKVVKKKKSYKEIRPKAVRPPVEDAPYTLQADKKAALSGIPAPKAPAPTITHQKAQEPKEFDHSLFKFDDNSDDDLDFDLFDEKPKETPPEKPSTKPQQEKASKQENKNSKTQSSGTQRGGTNSTLEVLKQKGFEIISGATIKNTLIDFIGIDNNRICLCLNDKEPGDWLADEERFNDEEPLWFSESSHRISPVRKIDIARQTLKEKLTEANITLKIEAFVIEQIGNIINAEDMFEVWKEMGINVTRIDRGTPKEIKLFAKAIDDADGKIEKSEFEKIKKIIRSIA